MPGTPRVPQLDGPKLTIPRTYQLSPSSTISFAIRGPPESPLQESLPSCPPAQNWVGANLTCLNFFWHSDCSMTGNSTFSFMFDCLTVIIQNCFYSFWEVHQLWLMHDTLAVLQPLLYNEDARRIPRIYVSRRFSHWDALPKSQDEKEWGPWQACKIILCLIDYPYLLECYTLFVLYNYWHGTHHDLIVIISDS